MGCNDRWADELEARQKVLDDRRSKQKEDILRAVKEWLDEPFEPGRALTIGCRRGEMFGILNDILEISRTSPIDQFKFPLY